MSSRRFTARFLTTLWFSVVMLSGCGLKGPLYLPDSEREAVPVEGSAVPSDPASSSTPVPSEEKKRNAERAPDGDTQTPVSPPDPDRPAVPTTDPQDN